MGFGGGAVGGGSGVLELFKISFFFLNCSFVLVLIFHYNSNSSIV